MPRKTASQPIRYDSITKEQRDEAVKLYGRGVALKSIRKTVGVTQAHIYRALEDASVPMRGRGHSGIDAAALKDVDTPQPSLRYAARTRKRKSNNDTTEKLKEALAQNVQLKAMIVDMMLEKSS